MNRIIDLHHDRTRHLRSAVLFLVACTWTPNSPGATLHVTNPGFEDISGESPSNEFTFGPLNGWELHDPGGIASGGAGATYFIGTLTPFEPDPMGNPGVFANFPAGAPEGERIGIAFNFFGSGGGGEYGFVQTLADELEPNTAYTLRVGIGNIDTATATNGQLFPLAGFPGYRVDLLAGGVVIAQDNNSRAGTIPDGEFGTSTVAFSTGLAHAQLGQPLGIRLVNLNLVDSSFPDSDLEVDFDDVRLDATVVPVPPALPLLATALAGIALVSRRRRQERGARPRLDLERPDLPR